MGWWWQREGGTVPGKRLESHINPLQSYGPGLDPDLSNTIMKRYFQTTGKFNY